MDNKTPITHKNQLMEHLERGCKPKENWAIGTENEQLIFQTDKLQRAPYEGGQGIGNLIESMQASGWSPIKEDIYTIAAKKDRANITIEPAGQFELSGAPLNDLHKTFQELENYHAELQPCLTRLNLSLFSQGMDPKTSRSQMPWMPKQRYSIMRKYMPTKGNRGLDMMTATTTVQANLDYGSEQDLRKKFRVSMALQPMVSAMFANSPIREGQLNGFKSYRAYIWQDTDPDRCGLLPFAFDENFTFEKYVDYILNVPMYFVYRDGTYHNHAGQSFKDFMNGKLPGMENQLPRMQDFEDHLTTAFPEVRIKQYLEMRGADSGPQEHMEALSAFWTGLLYDPDTLDEVYRLTKDWTFVECQALLEEVPRLATDAPFRGSPLYKTAKIFIDLSIKGLKNRGILNKNGEDESIYLDYLQDLNNEKICPADKLIRVFTQECDGNVDTYLKKFLHTSTKKSRPQKVVAAF